MSLNREVIGWCQTNIDLTKKEYNKGSEADDVNIKKFGKLNSPSMAKMDGV